MKPLKLEFSGLNSYRESQVVDFEELGRGGLFGIFGPTGSGKSSILDAITLALYGKVDRAAHDTRGIINQREKYLDVSFSFELGGTRYTVQRRYEKSPRDPEGVKAKSATLVQADGTVLADRADTVTKEIQERVGLNFSEFCQAVVLPQGKFDQFLRLTGASRAQMLGHIFQLDKFGDELYNAAVKRQNESQARLDSIEMAEKELGDCSDEAIAGAQEDLNRKEIELQEVESAYSKVKTSYDEAVKLRDLHLQLQAALEQKKQLDNLKSVIDGDLERLNLAKRADPLRDLIDTVTRLSRNRLDLENRLNTENEGFQKAEKEFHDAETIAELARQRRDREEPVLSEKKARLQSALDMAEDLAKLRKSRDDVSSKLTGIRRSIDDQKARTQEKESELKALESLVQSLESRQKQLMVDPMERTLLDEAVKKLTLLQNQEDEFTARKDELKLKKELTEKAWSSVLNIYDQLSGISASRYFFDEDGTLQTRAPEIPGLSSVTCGGDVLEIAEREMDLVKDLSERADDLVKEAMIHGQAAALAAELEEGRPCPVCGSLHHPNPASGAPEKYLKAQEYQKTIRQSQKALEAWYKKLQTAANQWDSARKNQEETQEKCVSAESRVIRAFEDFRDAALKVLSGLYLVDITEDALKTGVSQLKGEISLKDREYAEVSQKLEAARTKERNVRDEVERGRKVLAELDSQRNSGEKELAILSEQIASSEAKLFQVTGGEDPVQTIRQVESAIKSLRDQVVQAEKTQEELRKKVEEYKQRMSEIKGNLSRVEEELAKQNRILADRLVDAGFQTTQEAEKAMLPRDAMEALEKRINDYRDRCIRVESEIERLKKDMGGRVFSEEGFLKIQDELSRLDAKAKNLREEYATARNNLSLLKDKRRRWDELEQDRVIYEKRRDVAARLATLVRGKSFVTFLAEEYLKDIAADASATLGRLTGQRYALEISSDGSFVIRDDFNGGERRSVGTLSGGEMFLTSLSLALALSAKVQLKGQYPLGFFFLDEGFGTLDEEKLDAVINALERLHDRNRIVGVISHVKELKERLACYLEVIPAKDDGTGSRVVVTRR